MFSNLSSSSISLATVTPSLVMRGAPNDLSSRTLRPLGPSVTRTAWVSVSMPCNILSRASTENFTSLADISVFLLFDLISGNDHWASPNDEDYRSDVFSAFEGARFTVSSRTRIWRAQSGGLLLGLGLGLDQHPHNVALFHYEVLDAIDFDLGAGPFTEQDAVADLDVDGDELAALVAAAGSNGDDLALLRLLLGGVGNDDATSGLRLGIDSLDDNAVVKRSEFHRYLLKALTNHSTAVRVPVVARRASGYWSLSYNRRIPSRSNISSSISRQASGRSSGGSSSIAKRMASAALANRPYPKRGS